MLDPIAIMIVALSVATEEAEKLISGLPQEFRDEIAPMMAEVRTDLEDMLATGRAPTPEDLARVNAMNEKLQRMK